MSTIVLKQTERQFEAAVVEFSELAGWMSYHPFDSRRSARGFPDRVFVRSPCILFVEFKTERGRLSRRQRELLAQRSTERKAA